MKCAKRKRQITETEPVYRLFINVWVHWQMVCGICEAEAASRVFKTNTGVSVSMRPKWHPSRPCCHCSRPVFLHRPIRKGLRYFVCGAECRQAVHNANYRRIHPRSHVEQQCLGCGVAFTPKRNDAKFCSVACRQRAYRERVTIRGTTRRPGSAHAEAIPPDLDDPRMRCRQRDRARATRGHRLQRTISAQAKRLCDRGRQERSPSPISART